MECESCTYSKDVNRSSLSWPASIASFIITLLSELHKKWISAHDFGEYISSKLNILNRTASNHIVVYSFTIWFESLLFLSLISDSYAIFIKINHSSVRSRMWYLHTKRLASITFGTGTSVSDTKTHLDMNSCSSYWERGNFSQKWKLPFSRMIEILRKAS